VGGEEAKYITKQKNKMKKNEGGEKKLRKTMKRWRKIKLRKIIN